MGADISVTLVALAIAGLFVIYWAIIFLLWIGAMIVAGATVHLAWASEQGFLGVAAYVALWVIASPLMLIVSIIAGWFVLKEHERDRGIE